MNIPDFSEFLKTITPETQREISMNIGVIKTEFSLTPEGLADYAKAIALQSDRYTIEMLRLYHQWLAEQLS